MRNYGCSSEKTANMRLISLHTNTRIVTHKTLKEMEKNISCIVFADVKWKLRLTLFRKPDTICFDAIIMAHGWVTTAERNL